MSVYINKQGQLVDITEHIGSGNNDNYVICEFYNFRHPTLKPGFAPRYGGLIQNAATQYPKAWAYLQTTEGRLLCKTESEWQAMSTANYFTAADGTKEGWNGVGGVPFYVQDLNAGTLRLPDTRGMYFEDAGFDSLNVGDVGNDCMRRLRGHAFAPLNAVGGGWAYVATYYPFEALHVEAGGGRGRYGVGTTETYDEPTSINLDSAYTAPAASAVKPRHFGILPCVYLGS